jgi:glycosyltransferase involved in cell wall biosynthesis
MDLLKPMRILFVTIAGSIHTARWINQLQDCQWDCHVFDPLDRIPNGNLENVTVHNSWRQQIHTKVHVARYHRPLLRARSFVANRIPALRKLVDFDGSRRLASLIQRLKPDCIHTQNLQYAGYPLYRARELLGGQLKMPWICSIWGSDIYWFQNHREDEPQIRSAMQTCDYVIADCKRDIDLAYKYGFNGIGFDIFPSGGGFDIQQTQELATTHNISARRVIAVKGYQHNFGRAVAALNALSQCANILQNYKIVIYSAHQSTVEAAHRLAKSARLNIEIQNYASHERMLNLFAQSRVSIGISASDGMPNTLFEAMMMGAFPIQSNTSAADEWIEHGVNGFVVPHDDESQIAAAIRQALMNDSLVNTAAPINRRLVSERASVDVVQPKVIAMYERIAQSTKVLN